jgi:hypothetical protein
MREEHLGSETPSTGEQFELQTVGERLVFSAMQRTVLTKRKFPQLEVLHIKSQADFVIAA